MTIDAWLRDSTTQLSNAGVGTARLDCFVLLEDVTEHDRSWLLAHPEHTLNESTIDALRIKLERRTHHEPLAQIRGKTEFYGREFIVSEDVLEPRPESETMIELLKGLQLPDHPHIVDIGSGSGALGITAKLETPNAVVTLLDIDPRALTVSEANAKKHHTNTPCIESDLLANAPARIDAILANLPYVPDDYHINEAASHEPRIAIFGGPDGLDVYRRLFEQLQSMSKAPRYILTESLPFQHADVKAIAMHAGYHMIESEDFIQVFASPDRAIA